METKRILVVDDNRTITSLVQGLLEDTGRFTVRTENRGRWGLTAAKEFKPDLVLLDVMMDDVDGGAVAAQINDDPGLNGVPIVFLTAAVSKETVDAEGGMIGGNRFIAKPVVADELIDCIDKILA